MVVVWFLMGLQWVVEDDGGCGCAGGFSFDFGFDFSFFIFIFYGGRLWLLQW